MFSAILCIIFMHPVNGENIERIMYWLQVRAARQTTFQDHSYWPKIESAPTRALPPDGT